MNGRQKRPSVSISPDILARAVDLRREGRTWRAIEAETGASKSALHERFRADPDLAAAAVAADDEANAADDEASAADDGERAESLGAMFREALVVARGAVRQVAARVQKGEATTSDVTGLMAAAERALKLERLVKGRSSVAPPSGTLRVGVVVEHTPAETKALSGLAALRARAQILAAPTPPPDTKPDTKPPEPAPEAGKELTDGR